MDFDNFFNLYMRRDDTEPLKPSGVEFRYAAAALLVACSRTDLEQSEEEQETIRKLFKETFKVSDNTIERLFEFGDSSNHENYLAEITSLININFSDHERKFVLEKLWEVAYADGRIDPAEEVFIARTAEQLNLSADEIERARLKAKN
jgi:uncharacterized tellurite resistance protein B-like protein